MLTRNERQRYERQIMLAEIREEGQEKIKRAHVFIAGAGGLGSPIAIYLTAAGFGTIRIVDRDKVALSNLNRQILHWDKDVGTEKTNSAEKKLTKINPWVKIEAITETISADNISQLVTGFDVIIDATDNLPVRYVLNRAAIDKNIPLFHGAVYGFEGRAMTVIPGKTACLACIYRSHITKEGTFPVIGVTPAIIGCIQATEVIKYITGSGRLLTDRLLIYNGLDMKFNEFEIRKNRNCTCCSHAIKT